MSRARVGLLIAVTAALPAAAAAQTQADLNAATAIVNGRPQVRLRVRLESGWLPAEGIRIYRLSGTTRTLVYQRVPSDADADRVDPALKGRKVWTSAATPMSTNAPLDFKVVRPPSSATLFRDLKIASDALITLREQPGTDLQRQQALRSGLKQMSDVQARPPLRMTATALRPGLVSLRTLSVGDRGIVSARSRLTMAALVRSSAAESLGLGATDRGVRAGERLRYQVVAIGPRGDGALLDSTAITVGADPQPEAPSGIDSQQGVDDNGEPTGLVELRWDRLDPGVETALLNASYLIERRRARTALRGVVSTLSPTVKSVSPSVGGVSPTSGAPDLQAKSPADTAWTRVNQKPVMIAAINGDEEPLSFYQDLLAEPGTFEYRVALVDGFGRQSPWSEPRAMRVVDWRHPPIPIDPDAALDQEAHDASGKAMVQPRKATAILGLQRPSFVGPRDLSSWSSGILSGGRASVDVSWTPVETPRGLGARYRVFRINTEAANPAPVEITAQPIEGEVLPLTSKQSLSAAIAKLLQRRVDADTTAAEVPALRAKIRRHLEIATPRRGFTDPSVTTDAKYTYLVRAMYIPSGLESRDGATGVLSVPTPARPPVVQGARFDTFIASTALAPGQILSDTTGITRLKAFERMRVGLPRVAPGAKGYKVAGPAAAGAFTSKSRMSMSTLGASKTATGAIAPSTGTSAPLTRSIGPATTTTGIKGGTLTVGGAAPAFDDLSRLTIVPRIPVFAKADLQKLRLNLLRSRDDGGVVNLQWNATPNLRDVTYKIQRKYSNLAFADVGTTAPNQIQFRDVVPRSVARTYTYRVVSISRWGVEGTPSPEFQVLVPSTVQPTRPNLMAVAPDPGTDRGIRVRVDPNPAEESVTKYHLYRDGAEVTVIQATGSDSVELSYLDPNLVANKAYAYKVVAETGTGLRSAMSAALSARAVKTVAAAPASVTGTSLATGVKVAWGAAADAATYCVQRRAGDGGPTQVLAGTLAKASREYLDITALSGVAYTYEVIATDASGNVSPPAKVSVTTP